MQEKKFHQITATRPLFFPRSSHTCDAPHHAPTIVMAYQSGSLLCILVQAANVASMGPASWLCDHSPQTIVHHCT